MGVERPAAWLAVALGLAFWAAGLQSVWAEPAVNGIRVVRPSEGFAGLVVAEEPRAALAARTVLEAGGTTADAAAALALALSATYPVAASLGGGGVCLHFDTGAGAVTSIDFLPRQPRQPGPVAVPGLLKGLGLIQARWGALSWPEVAAQAEQIAGAQNAVSRALYDRLVRASGTLVANERLRALFTDEGGQLRAVGDPWIQPTLAVTLGLIRARGAEDFYSGQAAELFLEGARSAGGTVSTADLRTYEARVSPAVRLRGRDLSIYLPTEDTGSGAFLKDLWTRLSDRGVLEQDLGGQSSAPVHQAARTALEAYGADGSRPEDYGSTGFAVVSRTGDATVCGLTLNGVLGAGQAGFGDGVVLARAPAQAHYGLAGAFLAPLLMVGPENRQLLFAGVGSGTPSGVSGVSYTALATVRTRDQDLARAMALNGTSEWSAVQAIACPRGLPAEPERCMAVPDPQGAGLAVEALDTP